MLYYVDLIFSPEKNEYLKCEIFIIRNYFLLCRRKNKANWIFFNIEKRFSNNDFMVFFEKNK